MLFEAAHLGSAYLTGRTLWDVPPKSAEELERQTMFLLIDVLPAAADVARLVSSVPRSLLAATREVKASRRTIAAIKTALSEGRRLGRGAHNYFRRVVTEGHDAVLRRLPDRAWLSRVYKPDLSGFRSTTLRIAYSHEGRQAGGPLEWAIRQQARQSRHHMILETELGPGYAKRIERIITPRAAGAAAAGDLPRPELDHFERLGGRIHDSYGELKKLNHGHGRFYEADEIPERRFFWKRRRTRRDEPALLAEYIDPNELPAIVVPQGPREMRLLREAGYVNEFVYPHSLKSTEANRLIPKGKEHRFTLQDVCDMHVAVLSRMGIPDEAIRAYMEPIFDQIADGLRRDGHEFSFEFRLNPPKENLQVIKGRGMRGSQSGPKLGDMLDFP